MAAIVAADLGGGGGPEAAEAGTAGDVEGKAASVTIALGGSFGVTDPAFSTTFCATAAWTQVSGRVSGVAKVGWPGALVGGSAPVRPGAGEFEDSDSGVVTSAGSA
jgi:hypothetical protein